MKSPQQLLFVELNEINLDFVRTYVERGHLPTFARLIDRHGVSETESESEYHHLEPWIQWVSAHTGLSFGEHGVFRLGDIVDHDHEQIWERLERHGLTVGALSPMNAKLRARAPAFFLPDPWTPTGAVAPTIYRDLNAAISQAVQDNVEAKVTWSSLKAIALGGLVGASPRNYGRYLDLLRHARKKPWNRAIFLDLLLGDVFADLVQRSMPHFATLFLNAGAHIQHKYMFSSAAYAGELRNPSHYVDPAADPLLDIYAAYDRILATLIASFPQARFMIATGLHQDPYPEPCYYWRLRDHGAYLAHLDVDHVSVEPRMSRDFVVRCSDTGQARAAADRLGRAVAEDGVPLFEVDNRGTDLFVMLAYPHDMVTAGRVRIDNQDFGPLEPHAAFVALKNGGHNGIGYFIDTGIGRVEAPTSFPITEIPERITTAMGVA